MGLLFLLTSVLMSSYFHPGTVVTAQQEFIVRSVKLSIQPNTTVTRDTDVTLTCHADISSSGQLSYIYTIYKDSNIVYNKTSETSEDLLYPLPRARASNSGKYLCKINIGGKEWQSKPKILKVTGLSKPVLRLSTYSVTEGDKLTASCTAPGETGFISFQFYENSEEILEKKVNSNQVEVKFLLNTVGNRKIYCSYSIMSSSVQSNILDVTVKELRITPVLRIVPHDNIYEGDRLLISCTTSTSLPNLTSVHLYLTQGGTILTSGQTKINHTLVALAEGAEFDCSLQTGSILKKATDKVSVTELFSEPTLTISPAEVFQNDSVTITCKSERFASERIRREEIAYTLDQASKFSPIPGDAGVFLVKALSDESHYTCRAQAKGVVKQSKMLTVRPKISVSDPKISVDGKAVLGKPIVILCQSDNGSLPINYTLLRNHVPVRTEFVNITSQPARFVATITTPGEISLFACKANNRPNTYKLSQRLNAAVIEPLKHPVLTVVPTLLEISEGDELHLICSVQGTPPVSFKFYRNKKQLLPSTTSDKNHTIHIISPLSKEHSGKYYCEAFNVANNVATKEVIIEVRLAVWKKAVIGGSCLLVVAVLVVVFVLFFIFKRGKREAAPELSVKPASPKSDDSLTVTLTHDTEVYNAATVRMNTAVVSVWTKRPPEEDAASDEEGSIMSSEPDVEYTEVVHPRTVDPTRVPVRKGTDTVYSELQNSPQGAADHHDYGSVEYAELNGEQPEINHYSPEVNNFHDLPVPVD